LDVPVPRIGTVCIIIFGKGKSVTSNSKNNCRGFCLVNTHISTFNEMCSTESPMDVESLGQQLADWIINRHGITAGKIGLAHFCTYFFKTTGTVSIIGKIKAGKLKLLHYRYI
jgi:hypothetical protein